MRKLTLFLVVPLLIAACWGCESHDNSDFYLFVGTYTGAESEGIYLYEFDTSTGTIDSIGLAAKTDNPSYIAFSPGNRIVYAVNETADSATSTISSFVFDREAERLSLLNRVSSLGGAPCYISTDRDGRVVFAGTYAGGSIAMFPVKGDGSLAEPGTFIQHRGSSINESRQEAPHIHCTYVSPDNKLLFATDLGTDRLNGYPFDAAAAELNRSPAVYYETEPGAGPRHLTFHPNGRFAYLINELNGTVVALNYSDGVLNEIQIVSTLPDGYKGEISGADIHLSPDGMFLYVSNREDLNNIVIYSVNQSSGQLQKVGEQLAGGIHPRNFVIDPTGRFLLVANRYSDNITIFRRDIKNGMLTPLEQMVNISQPVCLKMIPVKTD